jgi:hypothetical protein
VIVEERNYVLVPGGVPRYLDQWHRTGRAPQVRHLGAPLGVYTVEIGELNTLVYLWQYEDFTDRAQRRGHLAEDPDFAVFRSKVRDLLVSQASRILLPDARTESPPPR